LTFPLARVKKKEIIKSQKPIIAVKKWASLERKAAMSDESKTKAGLPNEKGMGLFYFAKGLTHPRDFMPIHIKPRDKKR